MSAHDPLIETEHNFSKVDIGESSPESASPIPLSSIRASETASANNEEHSATDESPQVNIEGGAPDEAPPASAGESAHPSVPYWDVFVSEERLRTLAGRLDEARERVKTRINNPTLALSLLANLEKAQNLILQGKEYYEESERLLSEVECRLSFVDRVIQSSRKVGLPLFFYETAFFVLFAWALVRINMMPWYQFIREASPLAEVNLVQLLSSLIWGGLGGVVGALYALWKHVAKDQDFDPQYAL